MIGRSVQLFADHCQPSTFFGLPRWDKYLLVDHDVSGGCSVMGFQLDDIWLIAAAILEILLRVASIAAIIYIVWGGFRYLTSQGDPGKVNTARTTIVHSLAGLAVTIIASATVAFIFRQIGLTAGSGGLGELAATSDRIKVILNVAYGAAGATAALYIVIGGFRYTISNGDPQKASTALNTIIYAVVGLIIVIFATVITGFILNQI